jgi:hypothetical protein
MSFDSSWSYVFDDLDPLFSSPHSPTDGEIAEIVDRFIDGDLSNAEAEAAVERLARAKKRVLPVLIDLCRSTDPDDYHTGVILLKEMHLAQACEPLRLLLEDPQFDDEHKMSLLSALESLGGIAPDENPLVYLRDPETTFRKSHEAFLASLEDPFVLSVMLGDDLDHDVEHLFSPHVLEKMAATQDRRLLPLFICLAHAPEDRVVLAAIDGLRSLQHGAALPVLEERASWDASSKVRRAARQAAAALATDLADAPPTILHLPVAPPPVLRCLISTIDGNGSQMALIIRQLSDGERVGLDVIFNDQDGIRDCLAGRGETVSELETALLGGVDEVGAEVVDVTLPRVRAELERAYQISLKARRRLPPVYLAWRDWLCGDDDRVVDDYPVPAVQADEVMDLLARTAELFDLDEFAAWMFDPYDLRATERKYRKLVRREGAADAIEALIGQAITQVAYPEWCDRLRDRLERQAWLLAQIYEEDDIPRLALAAARALDPGAGVRPSDHPFLREMMRRSILLTTSPF